MTAKNRTSNKHKRPGVYIDQQNLIKESQNAAKAQERAKKFHAVRQAKRIAPGNHVAPATAVQAAAQAAAAAAASAAAAAVAASATVDDGEEKESNMVDGSIDSAAADNTVDATAAATIDGDGFTVSFQPFVSSSSSAIASTTESSLKDDKVLGVALYEWLLLRLDWDCHTLWEKFLIDWDLITETERPPGTNRPINLHSYLTYLKATNNKSVIRRDVRNVRETLQKEREAHALANPNDHRAQLNVEALNGTLLSYYLKIKNLIPYVSEAQQKRKEAKMKRKQAAAAAAAAVEEPAAAAAADKDGEEEKDAADADAIVESAAPPQPKRKKGKFAHIAAVAAASARPSPPTSTLKLGQANAFAALLDCD